MVTAARNVKIASIRLTLTPDSLAVFVSIDMAKRAEYLLIERITTRTKIILVLIRSKLVTEEIEPNKYDSKEFPPGAKSERIAARPSPVLIITAVAISPYWGNFFLIISIIKAAITQTMAEPKRGSKPRISPKPTPVRAV